MNTQIRKNEINLEIIGRGIILFGIWTLLKYAIMTPLYNHVLSYFLPVDILTNLYIILWIVIAIDIFFRFYIGFSARAEGRGKHRRIIYLVFTAVFFLIYVAFIILEIIYFINARTSFIESAITVIIDATSALFMFEVLYYACRLRRIKKNLNEGGQAE